MPTTVDSFDLEPPLMSSRAPFKGGFKLGLNELSNHGGSFARSVIIARLISAEDFGIAATFALMYSFLQMVSNLATETLIIQADNGDDQAFQDSTHGLQAFRGALIAAVLLATGGWIARLFGVTKAKWAFECLALV